MAVNAYEFISSANPSLIAKLNTNLDICDFLMGFYRNIEEFVAESPNEPRDLTCIVEIDLERLLKITPRYYEPKLRSGSRLDKTPFKRNTNIVELFKVNHNVRDVALRVVSILERWINEKPERKQQGFENIKLVDARRWRDNVFTAEIVLKFAFDEYVRAKMNWNVDESLEQPAKVYSDEDKKLGNKISKKLEWREQ